LPAQTDDIMPMEHDGRIGVWIQEKTFGEILAGVELEKGEIRRELEKEKVRRRLVEDKAAAIEQSIAGTEWRATWLPVIGFVVGFVSASAAAVGIFYAVESAK